MKVTDSIEEVNEIRDVTVTLSFPFKDGKCVIEGDQVIYDMVAPVGDEIITDEEEVTGPGYEGE